MSRSNESNQRIESTNRIIESNRSIESTNRNPKRPLKRPQNDPKTTPKRQKTTIWGVLGRSWGLLDTLGTVLAAILRPMHHKIENQVKFCQSVAPWRVDLGSQNGAQNDPKTTLERVQNQVEKCITFLSLLGPSWTGLEAILDPSWGRTNVFSMILQ